MERSTFSKVLKLFSEYSFFAQKAKGDISTLEAKKNLDIQSFLTSFNSFGIFSYALVDVSDLKIVKAGGAMKQITGYDTDYFEGKGFSLFLKLHKLKDLYKSMKGGNQYYKYLYSQEKEKRPFIKANRTLDLIRKDGSSIHVLVQGIPVLFNDKMEVIMFLLICTDISGFKLDRKFTHYIIDSSDINDIKKIDINHTDVDKENSSGPSSAELRVLSDLSKGLSSKEIAHKLYLSEHTVRTHRKNMLRKFACGSSSELIRKAILNGWI